MFSAYSYLRYCGQLCASVPHFQTVPHSLICTIRDNNFITILGSSINKWQSSFKGLICSIKYSYICGLLVEPEVKQKRQEVSVVIIKEEKHKEDQM